MNNQTAFPEWVRLGIEVTHPEIYWGNEIFKIVGIRENELELEGDWSGGTHAVCQRGWHKIEGMRLYNAKTFVRNEIRE